MLSQYKSWDYKILLILRILPKIEPIYILFHTQLETLRNYLDENLKKNFIQKAKTVTGFPILFIPKKDRRLRLYIDYRKLNVITIKNKYPLSNIEKFQDYLIRAKWFTKLDLHKAYNLVRIKEEDKWKITFKICYRIYKYQIILFRLINTSVTY